jgi:hypothetical protein
MSGRCTGCLGPVRAPAGSSRSRTLRAGSALRRLGCCVVLRGPLVEYWYRDAGTGWVGLVIQQTAAEAGPLYTAPRAPLAGGQRKLTSVQEVTFGHGRSRSVTARDPGLRVPRRTARRRAARCGGREVLRMSAKPGGRRGVVGGKVRRQVAIYEAVGSADRSPVLTIDRSPVLTID